jgi:hypothetical protein
MSATVGLESLGVPFSIGGEQVIDFDANRDGRGLGVDPNSLAGLTADPAAIANLIGRAVRDVAVGVNGKITAGLKSNFSIDIGSGSAFYLPNGSVAFRGSATSPFRGIGLDFIAPTSAGDVQGWLHRNGRWWFEADITNSGLAGLNSQHLHIGGSSASSSVSLTASVKNIAGFGNIEISGRAWFNGRLSLSGQARIDRRVNFVGGYFGASILGTLMFNRSAGGDIQVGARVEAGLVGNFGGFNINGGLLANVEVLQNGELSFQGRGTVRGKIKAGNTTLYKGNIAAVDVNLSRVTIETPWGIPDLRIDW